MQNPTYTLLVDSITRRHAETERDIILATESFRMFSDEDKHLVEHRISKDLGEKFESLNFQRALLTKTRMPFVGYIDSDNTYTFEQWILFTSGATFAEVTRAFNSFSATACVGARVFYRDVNGVDESLRMGTIVELGPGGGEVTVEHHGKDEKIDFTNIEKIIVVHRSLDDLA